MPWKRNALLNEILEKNKTQCFLCTILIAIDKMCGNIKNYSMGGCWDLLHKPLKDNFKASSTLDIFQIRLAI